MPFGGLSSQRGEMPFKEVMYYSFDKSLGLPEGVAALFVTKDEFSKTLQLCNTTPLPQTVWVQNGFFNEPISHVMVNNQESTDIEHRLARIEVPASQTVTVVLELRTNDFQAPDIPKNLRILADAE